MRKRLAKEKPEERERGVRRLHLNDSELCGNFDAGSCDASAPFAVIEDVRLYAVRKYDAVPCKQHAFSAC